MVVLTTTHLSVFCDCRSIVAPSSSPASGFKSKISTTFDTKYGSCETKKDKKEGMSSEVSPFKLNVQTNTTSEQVAESKQIYGDNHNSHKHVYLLVKLDLLLVHFEPVLLVLQLVLPARRLALHDADVAVVCASERARGRGGGRARCQPADRPTTAAADHSTTGGVQHRVNEPRHNLLPIPTRSVRESTFNTAQRHIRCCTPRTDLSSILMRLTNWSSDRPAIWASSDAFSAGPLPIGRALRCVA